jgi:tetratricopeptide (TPR) repeat protein
VTPNPAGAAEPESTAPTVDAANPWLGLASFTEETRAYFFGREEEIAELARRVQRKLLTVLFGQSGLGKTSILRAGLVPRLRGQGYCPVYVRIDYAREAPEPAVQIKEAIRRAARRSGEWTQAGVAVEGESLWEYLHHRDDVLKDEFGKPLIPLLIFDQFEEIFTLAQGDEFGRARAARFIADLADLVENRAPKELEAKLERDDSAAERFDFARSDYRVLIALREDYLAPLEGLKTSMPSITQNRLRLAPMNGTQALSAVMRPGGALVSDEVAAAIVRFVAGGAEIANAEVEPSLLSLICRELNDKRVAQGKPEISLDLLAGSHATILAEFYERALGDQPAAVRRIIEDELLTESGFRENVAEERLVSSFAAAGAAPGTLATLVNRRLLRIEERLDVRRVELTHDVLCGVVKASRDLRQEREARDRTEKLLQDQRASELAARQALVRARKVAAGCAVLALAAVVALGFAFVSAQRARRAEQNAQEIRAAAEAARGQAEHLLGYLNDDFATELAGFGRLGLIKELGKKEVDYYQSLPPSLQNSDTIRSAALAEVRYGIALQQASELQDAKTQLERAVAALDKLWAAGDRSEGTAVGLGLGLSALADVSDRQGAQGPTIDALNQRAVDTLRPYAEVPNAGVSARRAYATVAMSAATYSGGEPALALFDSAKRTLASLGAQDVVDLPAAADYTVALAFEAAELWRMGRIADLERVATQGLDLAGRVLAQRPGHLIALGARMTLYQVTAIPPLIDMHVAQSLAIIDRASDDGELLLRLDPANVDTRDLVSTYRGTAASDLLALGRPRAAIAKLNEAIAVAKTAGTNRSLGDFDQIGGLARRAFLESDLGDHASSDATLQEAESLLAAVRKGLPADNTLTIVAACTLDSVRARIALQRGEPALARKFATDILSRAPAVPGNGNAQRQLRLRLIDGHAYLGQAEFQLGNFPAAETAFALSAKLNAPNTDFGSVNFQKRITVWRSMALVRLGRPADAAALLAPLLAEARERNARNFDDQSERLAFATALYAQALVDPAHRAALLDEALRLIDKLPPEMRGLRSTQQWRERILQERSGR